MEPIDPNLKVWGSDRAGPVQVLVYLKRVRTGVVRMVHKITLVLN